MKIKNPHREHNVQARQPAAELQLLATFISRYFFEGRIGGELQRPVAENHGIAQRHKATHDRPSHPFVLLRLPFQRLGMGHDLTRRLADGNAPGMGERIITPSSTAWPPTRVVSSPFSITGRSCKAVKNRHQMDRNRIFVGCPTARKSFFGRHLQG